MRPREHRHLTSREVRAQHFRRAAPARLQRAAAALAVGLGAMVGAVACSMPAMSASGKLVTGITLEEHYALSNDSREVTFRGKALRRVVELFDKHRIFGLRGTYHATGVVDASRVVLVVRDGDDEKKVVIENCREPRFCAFVDEAVEKGELRKPFASCRSANVCTHDAGE